METSSDDSNHKHNFPNLHQSDLYIKYSFMYAIVYRVPLKTFIESILIGIDENFEFFSQNLFLDIISICFHEFHFLFVACCSINQYQTGQQNGCNDTTIKLWIAEKCHPIE